MLQITIPARSDTEWFDAEKEEFFMTPATKEKTLQLEHSLVSLRKWESKWCKPFLSEKNLTREETIDYIKCMTLTQNVPPEVYKNITDDNIKAVAEYINAPMTATWFKEDNHKKPNRDIVTAEVIYGWMISLQIPSEYQKWHLNQLMTLIRVCSINNNPPKKMGKRATLSRNAALNAARKKQLNTNG